MPEFNDIYVISKNRDKETINGFFEEFIPNAEPSADEYEFPQYSSQPDQIFENVNEALNVSINCSTIDYRFYWHNKNGSKPEHAMLLFLSDGSLIFGLSTDASDESYSRKLLEELKLHLHSHLGYLAWESSVDADSYQEFEKVVLSLET